MLTRLLVTCLLAGCAGPDAHRGTAAGSALNLNAEPAQRPAVASTLAPADPLAAATCALPTTPGLACPEAPAEGHQHHHGGAPMEAPAPSAPVAPPEDPHQHHRAPPPTPSAPRAPAADPHQHHRSAAPAATPSDAAAKVVDPMCKMKLDPATAKGGTAVLDGKTSFFCSSACRRDFFSQHPGAR